MNASPIPIALFAYSRPDHLRRLLTCLRENSVPLIYAFADGPKTPDLAERVKEVRSILHTIDWCEVNIVERTTNLGLGKSILAGVSEVFRKHDAIIVFEDDLICAPGTYQYLCAALEHYKDDPRVMSVTGWTHPSFTPTNGNGQPFFDGRACSISWGSWARAWKGMNENAISLMRKCQKKGIDIYKYGADLPETARREKKINVWAVRFAYLHLLHSGLCFHPPHSLVNHAGFDSYGTNATAPSVFSINVLEPCPQIPLIWPEPIENPECPGLYRQQYGGKPSIPQRIKNRLTPIYAQLLRGKSGAFFHLLVKVSKAVVKKLGQKDG